MADSLTALRSVMFCVFLYRNKDISTINRCRKGTNGCVKKKNHQNVDPCLINVPRMLKRMLITDAILSLYDP